MQIVKSLLAFGLVAATAATPVVEILERDISSNNPCDGGRQYCGWYDKKARIEPQCKCPKGFDWDDRKHACRAPPMPKPKVGNRQKAICARNKKDYCDYDEEDDRCRDDGKSVVIIIEVTISITKLEPIIQEECEKPKCAKGQYYDSSSRKCRYHSLPKEDASSCKKKGGRPVCARTPQDWCDFDERESRCDDDGINALQCVEPKADCEVSLGKVFASLETAIDILGFKCMNEGHGCPVKDDDYKKLCIGADCVADLLCSILGVIGLC